ncbi:hypothetical protein HHK36_010397 [Tetracentron sinense]|uniref:Cation/H+ exchanger domain-containing protein n=1 Tax=Tetracentron sinense TaxID=13715 RepID=A0A834ZHF4_TETSI|nr:hypothetical protein HHK36_010397 [Tetracentron sinense]
MVNASSSPSSLLVCEDNDGYPVFALGMEVSCILVLSHFFHLILKPLGLPGPIAQMLAGLVLGPSGLSQIKAVRKYFFIHDATDNYQSMAMFSRIIFMFLIGLEMDIPYLFRSLRPAAGIAFGGGVVCSIFAVAISPFMYRQTGDHEDKFTFALILMLLIANTASPVVIRLAAELNLATSDVGRLAISSSLINDISCLLVVALMTVLGGDGGKVWERIRGGIFSIMVLGVVVILNQHLARWLNQRNRKRKYLKNAEVFCILSVVLATCMFIELMGYNSISACFFIGMMFPREGKTARTLLHKLTYPVHNFILPIYFGFTGFQADITHLKSFHHIIVIVLVVLLSMGGKISGTLAACHYFKIPLKEGVVLAFLLNLKGHVDILIICVALQKHRWSPAIYNVLIVTIVINTTVVGPAVTFLLRKEREAMAFREIGLEWQNPESELRVLACVHCPRHVSTMVGVINAVSSGSHKAPITPYLVHLIELTEKSSTNLMYHQLESNELSDEEDYGGNDVLEINDAVDDFIMETGIMIRQISAVSPVASIYEDVCNVAEDIRASIILLPFHKHHRIDGNMEKGKEGIRATNQKVLRHSPCSAAILIDRGLRAPPQVPAGSDTGQHIVSLFFGGPDDREALAFSSRLAMHPDVHLTVTRFLLAPRKEHLGFDIASNKDEEVLMAISSDEAQNEVDEAFLGNFYNRYVMSGQVRYVEKYVENGAGTVAMLSEMGKMYSLFVVGKGGRRLSPLTAGMSNWEECPELGSVGDLLASSDFAISSSVLVIQQQRHPRKEIIDDEL